MWHECRTCGWWQKACGACQPEGCKPLWAPTALPSSSPATPTLQAKMPSRLVRSRSAGSQQSNRHTKIELYCSSCLSDTRTLGDKPACRGCQRDLSNCMRVLPGQWPPLNCPAHFLATYELAALNGSAITPQVPPRMRLWPPSKQQTKGPCKRSLGQFRAENSSYRNTCSTCPTRVLVPSGSNSKKTLRSPPKRDRAANQLAKLWTKHLHDGKLHTRRSM